LEQSEAGIASALTAVTQTKPTMNRNAETHEQPSPRRTPMSKQNFFGKVCARLDEAYKKHGREQWGRHEFYAILKEEVDELWDAIKADEPTERVLDEIKDIMCVCTRYYETGDRYRDSLLHPKETADDTTD
jgi:hypothetical protein